MTLRFRELAAVVCFGFAGAIGCAQDPSGGGRPESAGSATLTPMFAAVLVTDIDAAIDWYTSVLQLSLHDRTANDSRGLTQANLTGANLRVELIELAGAIPRPAAEADGRRVNGYVKIGFRVGDLDGWLNQLRARNVAFRGSVVQDPVSRGRTFLITDPDGNVIQFFEH